MHELEAMTVEM